MERQTIAYMIVFLLAAAILGLLVYRRYHGQGRAYHRRRVREEAAHRKLMAEKEQWSAR